MDITWYGHSCFRLHAAQGVVVTDPYQRAPGLTPPRLRADLVTVSHDHAGHNNLEAVKGEPFVIAGPGEYEVRGIFVIGVQTAHDSREGGQLGHSTAYCIRLDDLTVCHLGDLGHRPTQAQVEALGAVDVLLVPVGGGHTIGPGLAAEVVNLIDPALVIPMHFRSAGRADLEPAEKFLKEMGSAHPEVLDVLRLSPNRLASEPQVVLLQPKSS
jgi:L-ascorbate metabolism protein UlaG (beta-lactamase superfamily)